MAPERDPIKREKSGSGALDDTMESKTQSQIVFRVPLKPIENPDDIKTQAFHQVNVLVCTALRTLRASTLSVKHWSTLLTNSEAINAKREIPHDSIETLALQLQGDLLICILQVSDVCWISNSYCRYLYTSQISSACS